MPRSAAVEIESDAPSAAERYAQHAAIQAANQTVTDRIQWESADEVRSQQMIPLNIPGAKYVFRSVPGGPRNFAVRIATKPEAFKDDKAEARYDAAFARRRTREDGPDPAYDLEHLRIVAGGPMVKFRPIPGGPNRQQTCFYATSDEQMYTFLTRCKRTDTTGKWKDIIVEFPQDMVEINGRRFPRTVAGSEAARDAFLATPSATE
jgi:hypothetical protein